MLWTRGYFVPIAGATPLSLMNTVTLKTAEPNESVFELRSCTHAESRYGRPGLPVPDNPYSYLTGALSPICHTASGLKVVLMFSSVHFTSRWYLCARKSPYALQPVSQKFSQRCLSNGSNVRLTDDGPNAKDC